MCQTTQIFTTCPLCTHASLKLPGQAPQLCPAWPACSMSYPILLREGDADELCTLCRLWKEFDPVEEDRPAAPTFGVAGVRGVMGVGEWDGAFGEQVACVDVVKDGICETVSDNAMGDEMAVENLQQESEVSLNRDLSFRNRLTANPHPGVQQALVLLEEDNEQPSLSASSGPNSALQANRNTVNNSARPSTSQVLTPIHHPTPQRPKALEVITECDEDAQNIPQIQVNGKPVRASRLVLERAFSPVSAFMDAFGRGANPSTNF